VIKDRKSKAKDKDLVTELDEQFNKQFSELKGKLVDKLIVACKQKTSQGVITTSKSNHPEKVEVYTKMLMGIDFPP
jgi:DNA-directed RNA polymerase subunit beta